MTSAPNPTVEQLLIGAEPGTAALAAMAASSEPCPASLAAFALVGSSKELARTGDPALASVRGFEQADAWARAADRDGCCERYLAAAEVLARSADWEGCAKALRLSHDLALAERRAYLAAAALERLAHHAQLFGHMPVARAALADGLAVAQSAGLPAWRLRLVAASAALARDAGQMDCIRDCIALARSSDASPALIVAFAPAGATHALFAADPEALAFWTGAHTQNAAATHPVAQTAAAATVATIEAADSTMPLAPHAAAALRRALAIADGPEECLELWIVAARAGDIEDARFAVDTLRATYAPERPAVAAAQLLASAYLALRRGDRSAASDSAGDAARAFHALGSRRWTDEAMLLLVRHDATAESARRRPSAVSLTSREQQVAHLIRRGASNREVARTLEISEHTVERHVSSILSRLGLRSRWQIVDARDQLEH